MRADPTLLFYKGEFIKKNMKKERVLKGEVEQAIRKAGYNNYKNISGMVLETDGVLQVVRGEGNLVDNLNATHNSPVNR